MKRKQALLLYLVGTLGQILLVSLLVWLLRVGGVRVDYSGLVSPHYLILQSPCLWWYRRNRLALFFPACFARKVDLSSVHTLYIFGLVTMAYPLFLHWWVSGQDSFIAIFARFIKQLFYLIRHLYKDQKSLALCHDTCADQLSVATVICWEYLAIPGD